MLKLAKSKADLGTLKENENLVKANGNLIKQGSFEENLRKAKEN